MKNILIIGGSDAGISAAFRIRELNPAVEPTLIVADSYPNFSICGLPYYISREVADWRNLAHRTKREIEDQGVRLLLKNTAQAILPDIKQVRVSDSAGSVRNLDYDALLVATGAVSVKPEIPGIDQPGVFFLRWLPDCLAIDQFLTERKPTSAVIVGAGYIGMEMAEALTKRGLKVTLVEYAEAVLPSVDRDFGKKIQDSLIQNGISVYCNTAVQSIVTQEGKLTVKGSGRFEIRTDLVLVLVGSVPNTALGRSAGIETGLKGAFKVNRRMATNISDIYAAGDCVETWHKVLQKYTYLPLGTVAHKQGRIAGENMVEGNKEFAGTLGTQAVKIFDNVVARTGLNEKEAIGAGFQPVHADLETWDHKIYYPPAEKLYIRITADRNTQKILGAQMMGAHKTEVSKRIDIFAAAIYHDLRIDEFSDYDLSYTPPLSSPWDPVQLAAQKLEQKLK